MTSRNCALCSRELLDGKDLRYEVVIEVKAAYDPLEVTDEVLERDLDEEARRALEEIRHLTEEGAMDQVYRRFQFDLCRPCQREYIRAPLPR